MNEYEKSLINLSINQMKKEDAIRTMMVTSHSKRAIEILSLIPGSEEELRNDPEGFVKKYSLKIDPKEIQFMFLSEYMEAREELYKSPDMYDRISEAHFRYIQFNTNKLNFRDYLLKKGNIPTNKKVQVWRDRQVERCNGALGGVNRSFIHSLVTIELAEGCSVGCKFCGLNAGSLKTLYRYTDENAILFKGILKVLHDELGTAGGRGMMYFATEPLDNPDYELFEHDYVEEFGIIPQITTAVFDRNIERTRKLVHELLKTGKGSIHRFSMRSLEMTQKAFEAFTPEELLFVELLPQYPEAPGFVPFVVVGKEVNETQDKKTAENDPGTICCVDGFRINMPRKTLTIFTPCHMSEENPRGIAEAKTVEFTDVEDFRAKFNQLIDEYMVVDLPTEETLRFYDYFRFEHDDEAGDVVRSIHGGEMLLVDKMPKSYGKAIIDALFEGKYKKYELVDKIVAEYDAKSEEVIYYLNQFWKKGYIVDSKFFTH